METRGGADADNDVERAIAKIAEWEIEFPAPRQGWKRGAAEVEPVDRDRE